MGEFQEMLHFPPAPKLGADGKLDTKKATPVQMRGQQADGPDLDLSASWREGVAPYLHDGRLLTFMDTVEFFNLILL